MKKKMCVIALCSAMLLSGCGISDEISKSVKETVESAVNNPQNAVSTPTVAPTEAPKEQTIALGKKATVGDWNFKVTKAQVKKQVKASKYYYYKPSKGKKLVVVNMSVTNKGKKEETFLPRVGYANKMITAKLYYKDYEYKPSSMLTYSKDLTAKTIKPLETKKGVVAFEVPKKVAGKLKDMTVRVGKENDAVIYPLG